MIASPHRATVSWAPLLALLLALLAPGLRAQSTDSQVRASFLLRFGQYIEWPDEAERPGPLVIGVFEDPPLLADLERAVRERPPGSPPVSVRRVDRLDDLSGLSVLFLGTSDPLEIAVALSAARREPLLTVGYTEGFATRGGMINFYLEDRRLRFEVNRRVAEGSGFRISSQLLRLARIIDPDELLR